MSDTNWSCCPLVAQNPTMRAFIEQLVRERKSPSTIENYSRDLNDFLSAFPDIPFPDLLEADETLIAHYVDWLWTRDAQPMSVLPASLSKWRQKHMTNTSTARQSHLLTSPWQIPIVPETYPGRNPRLTRKEKTFMKQYIEAAGTLSGLHAKHFIDQLARFEQPYVDTVRLISNAKDISLGRRHLFTYMVRTGLAFWAWPKETWVEVIQTAPRQARPQGVRLSPHFSACRGSGHSKVAPLRSGNWRTFL